MAENKENSSLLSITDSTNNSQISMTESIVMSEGVVHSTPVPKNRAENSEIIKTMQMLFNQKFSKLDEKFNEQNSEIRGIQNNFNVKFDEIKNEIKKQNFNFGKQIDEMHARFDKTEEKIIALVNELSLIHI